MAVSSKPGKTIWSSNTVERFRRAVDRLGTDVLILMNSIPVEDSPHEPDLIVRQSLLNTIDELSQKIEYLTLVMEHVEKMRDVVEVDRERLS